MFSCSFHASLSLLHNLHPRAPVFNRTSKHTISTAGALDMVPRRPNVRNLAVRKRWRGKNARDRLDEILYKKLALYFMMTAVMLPQGILQHLMRANAYFAYRKYIEIDEWEDLPADRVAKIELTIDGCSEETCYSQYRFQKRDLRYLFIALRFPEIITLPNKSIVRGEKAFLLMLFRMAYPRRLVDMEEYFGREYSTVSRCFNFVVNLMDVEHSHLLLNNLEFFLPRFENYNRIILEKIAQSNNNHIPDREKMTVTFLDGTKREICRPLGNNNLQRAVYDGRLHEHNLGFQGMFPSFTLADTPGVSF